MSQRVQASMTGLKSALSTPAPVAVGLGQLFGGEGNLAPLGLPGPGAQHQVREVEVEIMRRHIRAFGHEAHVAKGAGVDDRFEIGAVDGIQLAGFRTVDQVEQAREAVTQVEAPAAAVTDVEHTAQFLVQLFRIIKFRFPPRERMAFGGSEAAFSHFQKTVL